MNRKDNLLNKIDKIVKRNYNNELENILEHKNYDENVKSILLGLLYKIEAAYNDYYTVKREVSTKDEYIEYFLENIKNTCKSIKIIMPNSEEAKKLENKTFLIDKENREIICYPIEKKILYSINKLSNKEDLIKDKYFLIDKTMTNLLNVGFNINSVEPLRDFNGWSWNTIVKEIESIEYNLIYQNLLMIVGNKFLNNWVRVNEYIIDYNEYLFSELENRYGNKKIINEIMEIIYNLSILLEAKYNPNIIEQYKEVYDDLLQQSNKFEDKQKYIVDLTNEKKKIIAQIKNIDTIINNKDLLYSEYEKRNKNLPLEKKIFSVKVLTTIMTKEREDLYFQIERCNENINPQKFIKIKQDVEEKLHKFQLLYTKDIDKKIYEYLVELQIYFMSFINERIKQAVTREEIIDLLFEIRYYEQLPISLDKEIKDIEKINRYIEKLKNNLIEKACNEKVLYRFHLNDKINYFILKNIFDIRIIDLEKIFFKIIKDKNEIFLNLFDESIFEEKIKIENMNEDEKREIAFKFNKKIKLFI